MHVSKFNIPSPQLQCKAPPLSDNRNGQSTHRDFLLFLLKPTRIRSVSEFQPICGILRPSFFSGYAGFSPLKIQDPPLPGSLRFFQTKAAAPGGFERGFAADCLYPIHKLEGMKLTSSIAKEPTRGRIPPVGCRDALCVPGYLVSSPKAASAFSTLLMFPAS